MELKPLNRKHQRFVEEYLQTFNGTQAYLRVYPKSTYDAARANAARLLASDNIAAAVKERLDEAHMSADEALKLLSGMARGDIAELMDVTSMGFVLDIKKAQEKGLTRLIKKVKQKTVTKIGKKEDDEDTEVHELEVELYDAQAAIDKILKVHGRYLDRVDVTSGGKTLEIGINPVDYRSGLTKTEE